MYRENNFYGFFFSSNKFNEGEKKLTLLTNFPEVNIIFKGNSIDKIRNFLDEINQEIIFAKESSK